MFDIERGLVCETETTETTETADRFSELCPRG